MYNVMVVAAFLLLTAGAAMFLSVGQLPPDNAPLDALMAFRESNIVYGESVALGNGYVRGWVQLDAQGNPRALGVSLSEQVLVGLPPVDAQTVAMLPAGIPQLPASYVLLDWHPLRGVRQALPQQSHLNVLFFRLPDVQRRTIVEGDARIDIIPETRLLPSGFRPVAQGVPQVGLFWGGARFPSRPYERIQHAFVYGSYDGQVAFIGPVISTLFLASKPNATAEIAQPLHFPEGVYFPSRYTVRYDTLMKEYHVGLEHLALADER